MFHEFFEQLFSYLHIDNEESGEAVRLMEIQFSSEVQIKTEGALQDKTRLAMNEIYYNALKCTKMITIGYAVQIVKDLLATHPELKGLVKQINKIMV